MDEGSEPRQDSIYLGKLVGCRTEGHLGAASPRWSLAGEQQGTVLAAEGHCHVCSL